MDFDVLQDDGRSRHGIGANLSRKGADPWNAFQKCREFGLPSRNFHCGSDVRLVSGAGFQAAKIKYPHRPLQLVRIHWRLLVK